MKNTAFFVLVNLLSYLAISAQSVQGITISYNSSAVIQDASISQVWSATLYNGSGAPRMVYIVASIDHHGKGLVYKARSSSFLLSTGTNRINSGAIRIQQLLYINTTSFPGLRSKGLLPPGFYTYCVQLYTANENSEIGEACTEVVYELNSPPQLVMPFDNDTIEEQRPLLSWLPPIPVRPGQNLLYDLRIVEVKAGQSAIAAFSKNPTYSKFSGLSSPVLYYPVSAPKVEIGKTYAWTVIAYLNGVSIPAEEVWLFTIFEPIPKVPSPKIYAKLSNNIDAGYVSVLDGILRFTYDLRYHDEMVEYKIRPYSQVSEEDIYSISSTTMATGSRRYIELDIQKLIQEPGFYILEVQSSKNTKNYLKFYFDKNSQW